MIIGGNFNNEYRMSTSKKSDASPPKGGGKTFHELMQQSDLCHDISPTPQRPTPHAVHSRKVKKAPDISPPIEHTEDEFMRSGLQHKEMNRLKQGKFRIGKNASLDLHGFTCDEAYQELIHFLDDCLSRGVHYVLIVCGKGLHSPTGKPVLKLFHSQLANPA